MVLQTRKEAQRIKLSGPIIVGKDILELLSTAMYVDPLSIYREYVQNAADSIDEAETQGLRTTHGPTPAIEITIDPAARSVRIRDKGAGVSKANFMRTLTAIGASGKRGTNARGFRGVGRFAGLGYCQELIMRSKTQGDAEVTAMHWDCRLLKERLRDPKEESLDAILCDIASIAPEPATKYPSHFFEIEMRQVLRCKNDVLLNEAALRHYLAQVAPVSFSSSFSFGSQIQEFLTKHHAGKTYALSVNEQPVCRLFEDEYEARLNVRGKFSAIEFFDVSGISTGIDAVGWILRSDYFGAIPDRNGISGLRLRAGNMQVGDSQILLEAFPEPRFNSWAVGECHVLSSKLVPNARRDNFEQSNHYAHLTGQLTLRAKTIAKACRERSAERTRERLQAAAAKNVNGHSVDWVKTKTFLTANAGKKLSGGHKSQLQKLVQASAPTYSEFIRVLCSAPATATSKQRPRGVAAKAK